MKERYRSGEGMRESTPQPLGHEAEAAQADDHHRPGRHLRNGRDCGHREFAGSVGSKIANQQFVIVGIGAACD